MIETIIYTAITVFFIFIIHWQYRILKQQNEALNIYAKEIDRIYKNDDEVLKYCLSKILEDAVENEDYNTAHRCKQLIDKLNYAN